MDGTRYELLDLDPDTLISRLSDFFDVNAIGLEGDIPLRTTLSLAKENLLCRKVLVEKNYFSADFLSQYKLYYSDAFDPVDRMCIRLHFFTIQKETGDDVSEESIRSKAPGTIDAYRGYVVVTPLSVGRVGKTVLTPWPDAGGKIGRILGTPRFLQCKSTARIYGNRYHVYGSPFISQDAITIVCAQASMFMATRFMFERWHDTGIKKITPAKITETAKLSWGNRVFPAAGLDWPQMLHSLSQLGFDPLIQYVDTSDSELPRSINWMMKYLDSDIPLILGVRTISEDGPDHAVEASGFMMGCDPITSESTPSEKWRNTNIQSLDLWLSALVLHDDGLGPYKIMPRTDTMFDKIVAAKPMIKNLLPPVLSSAGRDWWCSMQQIADAIILLPLRVSVDATHIDRIVHLALTPDLDTNYLYQMLMKYLLDASKLGLEPKPLLRFLMTISGALGDEKVITRSYLMRSSDFLRKCKKAYPDKLVTFYRNREYPLFVWVTDLYFLSKTADGVPREWSPIGELLIDATANPYGYAFLSLNVQGTTIRRDRFKQEYEIEQLRDLDPYMSLTTVSCKADD